MSLAEKQVNAVQKNDRGTWQRGWKALLLAVSIVAASVVSGCTGVVTAGSGSATIQLNPAAVSFGNVTVGKSSSQTVTIANVGTAPVTITQATLSNSQFTVSGMTLPMTVGAGQSGTATVSVAPTASGSISGTLSIMGGSGAAPAVVELTATGVSASPQIALSSSTVNFGSVTVGAQGTSSVTISNNGGSDLSVSGITVTGTGFSTSGITTPKTIIAGQSATLSLTFSPATAVAATGTVTVTSNDPAKPTTTISLSGTGTAAPKGTLQANQSSLSFGSVGTGTSSVKQIVLTNTGTAAVQISGISVTGTGFTASGVTVPATVNPSATATLSVTYAPTATGAASGNLVVTNNGSTPSLTIPLSGTGVQAGLTVSPATFNFGSVVDGQTKSQAFTITNSGTASLTISQLSINATGFSVNGLTVPATIAAGGTATFNAVFAPTTVATLAGSVSIVSNAPNSPATVALTGTGTAAPAPGITVSPASFNFGSVVDGQTKTQSFTITNSGNASLSISQLSISAAGYTVNGLTVPKTVAAGATTTFNAVFAPTTAGALAGTVSIVSNAPNSPTSVALNGTGVAATQTLSISPTSLAFGNVNTNTPTTKTVTITNTGNSSVQISQIAVSGTGYTLSGAGAPVTLTAGQVLTISVIFDPTASGTFNGSVTVSSNATGSPATVTLGGSGVVAVSHSVSLSWSDTGSSIAGYNVYRSTTSGSGYVKVNGTLVSATSYSDSTVQSATTYFYVTTAVDTSGNESTFSNQAQAVIP